MLRLKKISKKERKSIASKSARTPNGNSKAVWEGGKIYKENRGATARNGNIWEQENFSALID